MYSQPWCLSKLVSLIFRLASFLFDYNSSNNTNNKLWFTSTATGKLTKYLLLWQKESYCKHILQLTTIHKNYSFWLDHYGKIVVIK